MTALYNSSSDHIRILMTTHPVASLNTKRCHTKDAFERSKLANNWIAFSYNSDIDGKPFITGVEHRKLPYYGLAFHPEKIAFEWSENFYSKVMKIILKIYFLINFENLFLSF
jgi:gamma-glutamyl hydrolase